MHLITKGSIKICGQSILAIHSIDPITENENKILLIK